ncbi:hypothetical protein BWQ96_08380 [Gracilariopsis chorda]|uniref:TNFR-Cys domain-containing protein n=1 Tax=Gracilariopsis chorda TaxID=448386 RepID=A0A2V3IIM6_9FLOR|nr:hypothetical protein BWQ96_08380 [Gracilariopsis chorda]|eukprot:PXF41898.1 hypothetical protein BWQ96_08380 [Gracilariopsis chorda]
MGSKPSTTLPVLQLSVLLALTSLALAESCENVPLSFSTTVDLLASNDRVDVGSVTVTLENGDLSATYTVIPSCTLVDDIHVNLISTSSDLGISEIPRPGRFPCKKPASGSSESITCPISAFSIDDCCADDLRLFLHAVVVCGGVEDTAFGGSSLCSTERWCNFEDVAVDISCDVCNECSTSDAACVPVMDGLQPTECSTKSCSGNQPTSQSCQNGQCVTATAAPCPLCKECNSGDCVNVMGGSTPTGCDEKGCTDNSPFEKSCMNGECATVTSTPCPVCNECNSGACSAVTDGSMPTGCDEKGCTDNSPFEKSCMNGECATVTSTPCPVCNECSTGACSAVTDGSKPTGCDSMECFNAVTPGEYECVGGECKLKALTPCDECDLCDDQSVKCVFNTTSSMGEVCSTCGEICTPQEDGTGACVDRCSGQECTFGIIDEEDVCGEGCQDDSDCTADEDCIEGVCVDSSICTASKRALCDTVFQDLSGTSSNSGKCCPATAACVKNVLNLDENSVCSTECGAQCSATANAGSTNVREIYCVFGDETSTELTAADLPKCADLAESIPNDCSELNVCD